MNNPKICPYCVDISPRRIYCEDGCFVQFMSETERIKFFRTRCKDKRHKCNVYRALVERTEKLREVAPDTTGGGEQ